MKKPNHNKNIALKTEKNPIHNEFNAIDSHVVSWQFGGIDYEPNWCKKFFKTNPTFDHVLKMLKDFEKSTWHELKTHTHGKNNKSKHHFVSIDNLEKDAKKRIEKLKYDDQDSLYSLRINGTFRIWGIRELGYLKILWFDPDHEVYPVSN